MNRSKYIVGLSIQPNFVRRLEAVIFAPSQTHKDVAEDLFRSKDEIVGAGFVNFSVEDGKVTAYCYGESESLGGIPSRGEKDNVYVNYALGLGPAPSPEQVKLDFEEGIEIKRLAVTARKR